MKKADLKSGLICIEKRPSKHTPALHKVEVLKVTQHYEMNKKTYIGHKNYTYVYYKTCEGQYYPAANSTDRELLILDGLIGSCLLNDFKKQYTINNQ